MQLKWLCSMKRPAPSEIRNSDAPTALSPTITDLRPNTAKPKYFDPMKVQTRILSFIGSDEFAVAYRF